jgi:hypothetical protein
MLLSDFTHDFFIVDPIENGFDPNYRDGSQPNTLMSSPDSH